MLHRFILTAGWLLPLLLAALFVVKGRFYNEAFFAPPVSAASILPVPPVLGEWVLEAGQALPAERMFEKINGKADYYLQYGATALYSGEWAMDGERWDMYLYAFSGGQGARSAYNGERPAERRTFEGIEGYTLPGQVAVQSGNYYLQLNAQTASADTTEAEALARQLAGKLGGQGGGEPAVKELALITLAGDAAIGEAEGFYPESAFGYASLSRARTIQVSLDGSEAVWFTAEGDADTVAAFAEELATYGGESLFSEVENSGGSMFGTWEIVGVINDQVWGVHAAPSREALMTHWSLLKQRVQTATEAR